MNQDPWQWQNRAGEAVLVSPGGSIRRVQLEVQSNADTEPVWETKTSDAAMFVEALNLWENFAQRSGTLSQQNRATGHSICGNPRN